MLCVLADLVYSYPSPTRCSLFRRVIEKTVFWDPLAQDFNICLLKLIPNIFSLYVVNILVQKQTFNGIKELWKVVWRNSMSGLSECRFMFTYSRRLGANLSSWGVSCDRVRISSEARTGLMKTTSSLEDKTLIAQSLFVHQISVDWKENLIFLSVFASYLACLTNVWMYPPLMLIFLALSYSSSTY